MIWVLKNAVAGCLLFPCNFLLLGVFAWLLRHRRPRFSKVLGLVSFAGLWFLSTLGVAVPLIDRLESRIPAVKLDDPRLALRADAIVVLGAGRTPAAREYGGRDVVSPSGFLRLRHAVDIQRKTGKPILTTGGRPDRPGQSEGTLMADALRESFGTRAQWTEDRSANTFENARFSQEILAPNGIKKIFLVTHASHMARALGTFEKAGFEVVPAPMGYLGDNGNLGSILAWIPSPAGVEASSIYFHEMIGMLWYRVTGAY